MGAFNVCSCIPFKRGVPVAAWMPRGKKGAPPKEPNVTLGVPRALVTDMDGFLAKHPEYGIKNRNDFAARAIADKLRDLRRDAHERIVMEAYKAGNAGPLEEFRRGKT